MECIAKSGGMRRANKKVRTPFGNEQCLMEGMTGVLWKE